YGRPITGLAGSQKLLQQPPSIHVKSHTSQWRATASMEPMPAVEHHAYASSEASISNGCLHPLSCLMSSSQQMEIMQAVGSLQEAAGTAASSSTGLWPAEPRAATSCEQRLPTMRAPTHAGRPLCGYLLYTCG
ncbi:hypothetical protein Dimus_035798, partial [Dionaea muscipula]